MEPNLPNVLLVDGHSVIFAWPDLRALHAKKREAARHRLAEILARWADQTGHHVVIVFDGQGAKTSADPQETRVQIFYSRRGQSADSVIERLVAKYAPTHHITVVTDDHLERTTVTTFGAGWMSNRELLAETVRAEAELERQLQELRTRTPGKTRGKGNPPRP
jgi:predicted RNA-binding protein with PIN domain